MEQPQNYFVIGSASNIGKTTISSALIRVLNQSGIDAIGFKPVAGGSLKDGFSMLLDYRADSPYAYTGDDAVKLAEASPLTNVDMIDLICPAQLVFRQSSFDTFFLRLGSKVLHNVQYYQTDESRAAMKRPDFDRLKKMSQIPFDSMATVSQARTELIGRFKNVAAEAYQHLLKRSPKAVVCEGAGPYLPLWGKVKADHILFITHDYIYFYPNIGLELDNRDKGNVSYKEIEATLRRLPCKRTIFYTCEPAAREKVADDMIRHLLAG